MGAFYGNACLIYHDARFATKVLFLYIILPLMAMWVIIGLLFDLPATVATSISVPAYIHIGIIAITGFHALYSLAVGMGSTRVQFLKSFYLAGLGTVIFTMFFLNVCQYVLAAAYDRLIGWSNILHPAAFVLEAYHFLSYFWIDLMIGLFLFGFTFLFYCTWYRLGSVYSLIVLTAVLVALLFLYYGGVLAQWFDWLLSLNVSAVTAFTIAGAAGLAALLCTYPMMRNAPLQPKPRNN